MGVLDRRVVLVTGKGGVGKSLVSALIALRAARAGRRTLLCETSGSQRVSGFFGRPSRGYEIQELAPRLHTMSITSQEAIEDYILKQLHFKRLYRMVFRNRVVGPFMDAVPGLHDLIQLGKVFDLERERAGLRPAWDLIVVDAPATGHGLTMLASPRSMMDLTVAGPFHDNARDVAGLFEDAARTAIVLVTIPEEMPLHETEDLHARLGPSRDLVRAVVLNEVHPPPVPDPAFYARARPSLFEGGDASLREALGMVDEGLARVDVQVQARRRLEALGAPVAEVPFLFRRDLGAADLQALLPAVESL